MTQNILYDVMPRDFSMKKCYDQAVILSKSDVIKMTT